MLSNDYLLVHIGPQKSNLQNVAEKFSQQFLTNLGGIEGVLLSIILTM